MRILFVHNARRSFVQTDRDILAARHEVDELDLSVPSRSDSLPGRLLRADLVFAWFASAHSFTPVLGAALLGTPSVVVVGGYDTARMPKIGYGSMAHPAKRQVVRAICRAATALVVNSEWARQEVAGAIGTATPLHMIHHGFVTPDSTDGVEREPIVLSIGAVNRSNLSRKGHETFVRAAALVPQARFMMVGMHEGEAAEYLRSIATPNVELPGFLPQPELDALLQRVSVYAQVSAHEGFGCALAEAMAAGCVPVVSRCGALPEVAGPCGIYVPHGDPAAVTAGIREALTAPEALRDAARHRIADQFPLSRRRDALLDLVHATVADGRRIRNRAAGSETL